MAERLPVLLLAFAVIVSGFLCGAPGAAAEASPPVPQATGGFADASGPEQPPEAPASTYEAPPALAADLTSGGTRLRWESPERSLGESTRSRSRSGAGAEPVRSRGGIAALRPSSLPPGGPNPVPADQRLLLQTAQLSAG